MISMFLYPVAGSLRLGKRGREFGAESRTLNEASTDLNLRKRVCMGDFLLSKAESQANVRELIKSSLTIEPVPMQTRFRRFRSVPPRERSRFRPKLPPPLPWNNHPSPIIGRKANPHLPSGLIHQSQGQP